jgi:hypothetical protein
MCPDGILSALKVIEIVEKYDLCISLEVAEHISEIKAKDFIDTLCKASNVVLFSAAIKHQGGTNHINEQWQSYCIKLFESNGYECFDIFREAIWQNEAVNSCYRQNIFLFVNRTSESVSQNIQKIKVKPITNTVHPKLYEKKIKYYTSMLEDPTLIFCLVCIKRYVFNKINKLRNISPYLSL